METFSDIRYYPELERLVINQWVFYQKEQPNPSFICSRSSGVNDYVAEWWYNNNKYQLKWKTYHEYDVNVCENGTLIKEVDSIYEVLVYCHTHLHPHSLEEITHSKK